MAQLVLFITVWWWSFTLIKPVSYSIKYEAISPRWRQSERTALHIWLIVNIILKYVHLIQRERTSWEDAALIDKSHSYKRKKALQKEVKTAVKFMSSQLSVIQSIVCFKSFHLHVFVQQMSSVHFSESFYTAFGSTDSEIFSPLLSIPNTSVSNNRLPAFFVCVLTAMQLKYCQSL